MGTIKLKTTISAMLRKENSLGSTQRREDVSLELQEPPSGDSGQSESGATQSRAELQMERDGA